MRRSFARLFFFALLQAEAASFQSFPWQLCIFSMVRARYRRVRDVLFVFPRGWRGSRRRFRGGERKRREREGARRHRWSLARAFECIQEQGDSCSVLSLSRHHVLVIGLGARHDRRCLEKVEEEGKREREEKERFFCCLFGRRKKVKAIFFIFFDERKKKDLKKENRHGRARRRYRGHGALSTARNATHVHG